MKSPLSFDFIVKKSIKSVSDLNKRELKFAI